jgi:hypothetical protein
MLQATCCQLLPWCKGGVTPRQQLATCCLQHFLVMTGNITKKCCRSLLKNIAGNMLPIVALV